MLALSLALVLVRAHMLSLLFVLHLVRNHPPEVREGTIDTVVDTALRPSTQPNSPLVVGVVAVAVVVVAEGIRGTKKKQCWRGRPSRSW